MNVLGATRYIRYIEFHLVAISEIHMLSDSARSQYQTLVAQGISFSALLQ